MHYHPKLLLKKSKIMSNKIPLIIFSLIFFSCQQKKIEPDKYKPEWSSLSKHNESPKWFEDAKFGIYFHWGVYTVPEFSSEWYPRNMH